MSVEIMDSAMKKDFLERMKARFNVCKKDADVRLYGMVLTCFELPSRKRNVEAQRALSRILVQVVLSDEQPVDTCYLTQEDFSKWTNNLNDRFQDRSQIEEMRRFLSRARESIKLDEGDRYSLTSSRLGDYRESPAPTITIYYRNLSYFEKWMANKDNPDLKSCFEAEICMTYAHEYFHHIHHCAFKLMGKKFSIGDSWEKRVVAESLADYFAIWHLNEHFFDVGDLMSGFWTVIRERTRLWEKYFGSPWPYAYALLIERSLQKDARFNEIFHQSVFDWHKAYLTLMDGTNIQPFEKMEIDDSIGAVASRNSKRSKASNDIVLAEFGFEKTKPTFPTSSKIPKDAFVFVYSIPGQEIHRTKDASDFLQTGQYAFHTPFLLFYLYDPEDPVSCELLKDHGADLCNRSSANVTILTFLKREVTNLWDNVIQDGRTKSSAKLTRTRIHDTLQTFENTFDASKPFLILVKKQNGEEESAVIPLEGMDSFEQFRVLEDVLHEMEAHPDVDVDSLSRQFNGNMPALFAKKNGWKESKRKLACHDFFQKAKNRMPGRLRTIKSLADRLHCDESVVRFKRDNATFTRGECLKLGIQFYLSIDELNAFLRLNGLCDLNEEEERAIKRALKQS